MASDDKAAAKAVFQRACDTLMELQDDLGWKHVTGKFKVTCAKWAQSLSRISRAGGTTTLPERRNSPCADSGRDDPCKRLADAIDLPALWELTVDFRKVIKPTSLMPRWTQEVDGQPPVGRPNILRMSRAPARTHCRKQRLRHHARMRTLPISGLPLFLVKRLLGHVSLDMSLPRWGKDGNAPPTIGAPVPSFARYASFGHTRSIWKAARSLRLTARRSQIRSGSRDRLM